MRLGNILICQEIDVSAAPGDVGMTGSASVHAHWLNVSRTDACPLVLSGFVLYFTFTEPQGIMKQNQCLLRF